MREYINIYQLDTLSPNNIRNDDYLIVSQNSLSYKFQIENLSDFVIDNIDTTIPVYNANKLLGYSMDFSEPLQDHQLLTFDLSSNSWINKELDIDAIFRFEEYEPNKFLRLDNENKVITSDVYVSDIVVDTPDKADHFLSVHDNGSDVVYVDIYQYINDTIDTRSDTFVPLLNDEIQRATDEETRIESLLNDEIQRATDEESRIEDKFDNELATEIQRATDEESRLENLITVDTQNAINSNITEIDRVENDLSQLIQNEENRATDEERRLENLLSAISGLVDSIFPTLFPVGSVLMRPVDPGNSINDGGIGVGVWEKIEGVSLVASGTHTDDNGDSRTFIDGEIYGEFNHTITVSEIPSHGHSGSTGSAGLHDHDGNTNYAGLHDHGGSTTSSSGAHSHPYTDSYYIEKNAGYFSRADGIHRTPGNQAISGSGDSDNDNSYIGYFNRQTGSSGSDHSHFVNLNNDGSHNHTVNIDMSGLHTHTVNVGDTGGDESHNNLHPVLAVPMWMRIQ